MKDKGQMFKDVLAYLLAVAICMGLFIYVAKLWRQDFNVPGAYSGDSFASATIMKGFIEKGTYLFNDRIGAPYGANLNDFPSSDSLHYGIACILSLFTHKWETMMQLIFLVSFPLSVISAMFVFRYFKSSLITAIVGSVLFAFLPYHFLRGINHLFLACYFSVPFAVLIALEILNGNFALRFKTKREVYRSVIFLAGCAFLGCSGVYYAYFACFFFLLAGLISLLREKSVWKALSCLVPIVLVFVFVFLNLLPSIMYSKNYGGNPEVAVRSPVESELYGLKIAQIVLPESGHRIGKLARIKNVYNTFPLVNENDSSAIGAIGTLGFILLLVFVFIKDNESGNTRGMLKALGFLNLGALLFATVGGFGALFSLLISPKIRAYNRISIFIAFFALFAVVILFDWLILKAKEKNIVKSNSIILAVLFVILAAGVLDQTTRMSPSEGIKQEYLSDRQFVSGIEKLLPKNSMIFQLPYVPYPENPPVNKMGDYEQFRGYLNSRNLRWSYGVIKGRIGDEIYRNTAELPAEKMLEAVVALGYSGVYIDRFGYVDNGSALEKRIGNILNESPVVSANKRLSFFDLSAYSGVLLGRNGAAGIERLRKQLIGLEQVNVLWLSRFYPEEKQGNRKWRWCASKGEVQLVNLSGLTKKVTIQAAISSGYVSESELKIECRDSVERIKISSARKNFSKVIELTPGVNKVVFSSNAPRVAAENDFRDLRFALEDFKVAERPGKENK